MTFSKETLELTLQTLDVPTAMRMIAMAGGRNELTNLVSSLARNFNAAIPSQAIATINDASKRWHDAQSSRMVSYRHD